MKNNREISGGGGRGTILYRVSWEGLSKNDIWLQEDEYSQGRVNRMVWMAVCGAGVQARAYKQGACTQGCPGKNFSFLFK